MIKLKCENCGGELEVNSEQDKIFCHYCGAKIFIDDDASKLRRVEDAKLQARKQNHEQAIKEKKDLDELNAVDNFKKGKLSKWLLVFAALCGIITFTNGFSLAGIIAFIQTALFIGSWLLGMEVIKHPNKKLYIILALAGFALIIPFFALGNRTSSYSSITKCKKIDWDNIYLKNEIASIDKPNGEIHSNSKNELYLTLCGIDQKTYEIYHDEIIKKGYTVDAEDATDTYLAYNEEGYKIYLDWDEDDKELSINLEKPMEMSEISWPTTGLATKIPKPNSTLGKISWDNEDTFSVYIGNITKQDFENYIKLCQDIGFVNNHSKTEKRYSAENNEKYELDIEYKGNNTMYVSIDAPDEDDNKEKNNKEETKKEEKKSSTNNNLSTSNNDIRSDFKSAMDSYEKYIDEYITFMNKYNSNPTDYELIKEYTKVMKKYNEAMKNFEKWEDNDLNDAENAYYIEVQTRVNKKLMEASLQ